MAAKYITKTIAYNQSIIDFVMQYYGCFEGIAQIMSDNPQITSMTQELAPSTSVRVLKTVPQMNDNNLAVLSQYAIAGTQVATGTKIPASAQLYLLNEDDNILLNEDGTPLLNENA